MVDVKEFIYLTAAGIIGGIIASLSPLVINRIWNHNVPDVKVSTGQGVVCNEAGITNHLFGFSLTLVNGTDGPMSFSTPRLKIKSGGLFSTKWEEAQLVVKGFTMGDLEDGTAPETPVHVNGMAMKNPFQTKNIRIESHDFITSYIEYNRYDSPTHTYKRWYGLLGKRWIEGRLIVEPAGCRKIIRTVRFDPEVVVTSISHDKKIDQNNKTTFVYSHDIYRKKVGK